MPQKRAKTLLLSAIMLILSNLSPAQSKEKPIIPDSLLQQRQPTQPTRPTQQPRPTQPAQPKQNPIPTHEPEMVFVQGGTFTMGCTSEQGGDCYTWEKPAHQVTVSSFNISKYPITQGQWKTIMGTTVRDQRDKKNTTHQMRGEGDNYPIYYVSWDEAQEFIRRLNSATGKNYRLPTEAEWEFAARGGTKSKGYKYSGSNNLHNVAWHAGNQDYATRPVGTKIPNELGIYDMSGNVYEWCSDWFGDYSATAKRDPTGPSTGSARAIRGGSWNSHKDCRVAYREGITPSVRDDGIGFRVVLP